MADTGRDFLRFAGAALPGLFGPLAVANEASYALFPRNKASENKERAVGTVVSYLNDQPYEIYAGKDYGPQTVGSYLKLRQAAPDQFPRPAGLGAVQPKPQAKAPTPPATNPDWQTGTSGGAVPPLGDATADWGTAQDVETGTFPTEARTPGKEPGFEEIVELLKTQLSPEARREATNEAIRQFVATSTISQALGAEKSRERYKREVELERIKQWTDLAKTTQQTNLLSQALLGQALIASQQPSAAMADVLGKGTQAAQSVLGGFQLKA